ncbi:hypothetical protein OAD33_08835 [Alphaproteobacteria bacterium]|nr:hypothetical protein [Alphaproteobacteria bacterium]
MFNFFKNKAYDLSISTMKTDMSRFVEMLKGMDDCAIGGLVVGANWVRKNLEQHGQIPDKILSIGPVMDTLKCNQASLEISKAIKNHQQQGNNILASFMMVWLHSLRSLSSLELIPMGKNMWVELERGFLYVDKGFETVETLASTLGLDISESILEECKFVPTGLENDFRKYFEKR